MRAPLSLGALLLAVVPVAPLAQQPGADTHARIQALQFPPLRFNPPQPKKVTLSNRVTVYLLEDHALPVINVQLVSRVGVANLPDSLWGVGWQADGLLRTGGTTRLTPDSVDKLVDLYALNISFSTDHEQSNATLSGLSRYTDQLLDLGFEMMKSPRNDTSRVRILAAQQEENWRRRNDTPGSVLGRAWSQVIMGSHPLGRSLVTPDEIAGFTPDRFRWVQQRLYCPQNFLIGVSGDFQERQVVAKLESLFRGWAPCQPGLREVPPVTYAQGPRVVLVEKDVNQTNIRMGHGGGIRVANTPDYFASQVADFLLGGSGFTSRLLARVRSDSGFAYSAFSAWGADTKREDLFFAGAQIRAEKSVAGIALMRTVIGSMASEPVTAKDVKLAQDNEVNSFVFRFENASQIVGQQLSYAVDGLPANWFDVYLRGIQGVTPEQVRQVSQRYLHPDKLVIVVVGKPSAFDKALSALGAVTPLPVDSIRR
ncbi:MAG TPA: pitrilysin family protein [Gemmatimonadales bacterium]|jgi:predicted Zn-dependent peptidase|nr:pitrilysin family protein [Gemmatimonadales bacterium]